MAFTLSLDFSCGLIQMHLLIQEAAAVLLFFLKFTIYRVSKCTQSDTSKKPTSFSQFSFLSETTFPESYYQRLGFCLCKIIANSVKLVLDLLHVGSESHLYISFGIKIFSSLYFLFLPVHPSFGIFFSLMSIFCGFHLPFLISSLA